MSLAVVKRVAQDILEVMGGPVEGGAEFIAGPDRSGIAGGVQDGARYICRQWARTPAIGDDGRLLGIDNICTPYLQSLNEAPIQGGGQSVTGGQCTGVKYRVTVAVSGNFRICSTNDPNSFSNQDEILTDEAWGPVLGARVVTVTSKSCGGSNRPNRLRYEVRCAGVGGNSPSSIDWYEAKTLADAPADRARDGYTFSNIRATLPGGGDPNACGGAQPRPSPQPGLPPLPPTVDVESPYGPLPFEINLLPDLTIDLSYDGGDVNIDPFGPTSPGAGGGPGRTLFEPPSEPPVLVDPGDEITPPFGRAITSVRVGLPAGYQGAGFNPFITNVVNTAFFPRCGYIVFRLVGGGVEGPYNVQLAGQVITCRFPGGATSAIYDSLDSAGGVALELYTLPIDKPLA